MMSTIFVRFLLVLAFLGYVNMASAQRSLSEAAEIRVLTCGSYQGELYAAFGHSAIRVYDPIHGIDWLFNYGVFDFDQPHFYLNFTRGYLNYKLAVVDYSRFKDFYVRQNRYIREQILNLTAVQKQRFFDFLRWNAQPENQYYRYDYFYDNCATRVRDAVEVVLGDQLVFDSSYIDTDYTIRELMNRYMQYQPWGNFGINLCLGLPIDKIAPPRTYMYLPEYIEKAFDHAFVKTDSSYRPLVANTVTTYESKPEAVSVGLLTPLRVFLVVFIIGIIITAIGLWKNISFRGFDIVLFVATGTVGLILVLLWVATDHRAAAYNMNLSWALPTHLIAGLLLMKKNTSYWLKNYFFLTGILGMALLTFLWVIPQPLHLAIIPIVLLLSVRGFFIRYKG